MNRMEAVAPADLNGFWPFIRDELSSIEAPDRLIPEEVYAMCRGNEATMFGLYVDDARIGWMVLRIIGKDLHVWLLYATNGCDVMTVFRDQLMEVAKTARARMITFGTKRRGWHKVAPKHGFTVRQTVYECPVI